MDAQPERTRPILGFRPRMGPPIVATGGAKRNPWSVGLREMGTAPEGPPFWFSAPDGAVGCSHGWSEAEPVAYSRREMGTAPEGQRNDDYARLNRY